MMRNGILVIGLVKHALGRESYLFIGVGHRHPQVGPFQQRNVVWHVSVGDGFAREIQRSDRGCLRSTGWGNLVKGRIGNGYDTKFADQGGELGRSLSIDRLVEVDEDFPNPALEDFVDGAFHTIGNVVVASVAELSAMPGDRLDGEACRWVGLANRPHNLASGEFGDDPELGDDAAVEVEMERPVGTDHRCNRRECLGETAHKAGWPAGRQNDLM